MCAAVISQAATVTVFAGEGPGVYLTSAGIGFGVDNVHSISLVTLHSARMNGDYADNLAATLARRTGTSDLWILGVVDGAFTKMVMFRMFIDTGGVPKARIESAAYYNGDLCCAEVHLNSAWDGKHDWITPADGGGCCYGVTDLWATITIADPTGQPSTHPTVLPSSIPTSIPTEPSSMPSGLPTTIPTSMPTLCPYPPSDRPSAWYVHVTNIIDGEVAADPADACRNPCRADCNFRTAWAYCTTIRSRSEECIVAFPENSTVVMDAEFVSLVDYDADIGIDGRGSTFLFRNGSTFFSSSKSTWEPAKKISLINMVISNIGNGSVPASNLLHFTGGDEIVLDRVTVVNNNESSTPYDTTVRLESQVGGVQITGCIFESQQNLKSGVVSITDSERVKIAGSRFTSAESSSSGGSVLIRSSSDISIETTHFENSTSLQSGGAIYIVDSSSVVISGSYLKGCSSADGGGAIFVDQDNVDIRVDGSTFLDNAVSGGSGGAILFASDNRDVSIESSMFDRNMAMSTGGALAFTTANTGITLSDSNFSHNSAIEADGGAVSFSFGNDDIEATGCFFVGNSASRRGGAIVFIEENGSPMISASSFDGNSATTGGAVYVGVFHDLFSVMLSSFTRNSASSEAGALSVTNCDDVEIATSYFGYNVARLGAAIKFLGGEGSTLTSVTFEGNVATRNGGGIVFDKLTDMSLTDCVFIENESATFGGGVHVESTVLRLLLSSCSFIRNVATNGAGLYDTVITYSSWSHFILSF